MAGLSESEISKKVQFIINSSSAARTRLYKTNDTGLLEPVNDLDIVESLLIQAVHSAFKGSNVVLLKSCLRQSQSSPRKSKKKVRLLLPPDSRGNLDEDPISKQQDSSKKVRFLLHTDSVDNLDEIKGQDDQVSDSQDVSTLGDLVTLQELDISWDEVHLDEQPYEPGTPESEAFKRKETKQDGKLEQSQNVDAELNGAVEKGFVDDVEDPNGCPCENWEYSDDDFESIDTDTERESFEEESASDNSFISDSAGTSVSSHGVQGNFFVVLAFSVLLYLRILSIHQFHQLLYK